MAFSLLKDLRIPSISRVTSHALSHQTKAKWGKKKYSNWKGRCLGFLKPENAAIYKQSAAYFFFIYLFSVYTSVFTLLLGIEKRNTNLQVQIMP